jgi:hypothetical protein
MLPLRPQRVLPAPIVAAVGEQRYWFVIGGHAVRCFAPYRPSRDVDFGVSSVTDADALLSELERHGAVEILERSSDTTHLRFRGVDVSIFVLDTLAPFTDEQRLTIPGLLATKLHAILDRGMRRDFFDLYVLLQQHGLGIVEALAALRAVHGPRVRDGLLLRALTYFGDAEKETALPGEGPDDWETVKRFFLERVGQLLVPPARRLAIQERVIDVLPEPSTAVR